MLLFLSFTFLWNFVILMLRNLKLSKLGSVSSWDLKPRVTEGLQETSQPYPAPWVAFYHVSGTCGLQIRWTCCDQLFPQNSRNGIRAPVQKLTMTFPKTHTSVPAGALNSW
jgi:hypothetical protein